MRIAEVRDLDGPNLFMMNPAIKTELADVPAERAEDVTRRLEQHVRDLHIAAGKDVPEIVSMQMEAPGHLVVAFAWTHRPFATALGEWAAQLTIGERDDADQIAVELREILAQPVDEDDEPLLIRDADRTIPIIAVTGTNGKTTTSRLIASVLRRIGHTVGLTSSAGVYINSEAVLTGDYSGPSGARRVMADPTVDMAVLETARGGMLLRGCGFEHSDVSVITNVSADHLGIHGVFTLEGLARVKEILARVVRPGGYCVLNADDPYVLNMKDVTPGEPALFSREPERAELRQHIESGGKAIFTDDAGDIIWCDGGSREVIANVSNIPMTFNGDATHQVENAMAAAAGLLGLGVSIEQIREGLAAFRSSSADSKGRLNVYELYGATVIIDFAHNEAGLGHLLNFAHGRVGEGGRVISIVGTAGDRDDAALQGIARRAVEGSDIVVLKDSRRYLRGREHGDMLAQMRQGVEQANRPDVQILEAPDERSAADEMLQKLRPGDVLAVMCVEEYDYLLKHLDENGSALS